MFDSRYINTGTSIYIGTGNAIVLVMAFQWVTTNLVYLAAIDQVDRPAIRNVWGSAGIQCYPWSCPIERR